VGALFKADKSLLLITEQREQIAYLLVMQFFQTANAVFKAFETAFNATGSSLIVQDTDQDHQGWNGNHGEKLPDG
jgi:hypothetical protein